MCCISLLADVQNFWRTGHLGHVWMYRHKKERSILCKRTHWKPMHGSGKGGIYDGDSEYLGLTRLFFFFKLHVPMNL